MSPLNREILRLAIPSIFANITVPIVGMVDLAVAGHLDGDAAVLIGGVSIGTLLFDLLYWNFSFLRIGTGGLTAQAYGRGDMKAAADALFRSSGMALIIAAACILAQWVFVDLAFLVVKCSPEVRELAEGYFHVRIWAAPATLTLMAVKGWFIGMQDSVRPMITDLIDFDEVIEGADLVITGEGCSDYQTLKGKTAAGVLERARRMGIPVALVSGAIRDEQMLLKGGFHIIEAVSPQGMSLAEAMRPETAKHNIYETVKRLLLNE